MKDFYELFIHELKNVYSVENQLIRALPKLIDKTHSKKLKEALRHHLHETKDQLRRLEEIALELSLDLNGYESQAIKTLIKEAHRFAKNKYDSVVKDAGLITNIQQIEHYEIACYGALKAYAKHFKFKEIEALLEKTSAEEGEANKTLTEIAEGTLFSSGINTEAHKKCIGE